LAQAGQYFAGKIGTIFVGKFFVGMEWKPPPRQAAGTLAASMTRVVSKAKFDLHL